MHLLHQAHGTGRAAAAAAVLGMDCIYFTFSSIPGFAWRREKRHTPRNRTASQLTELADTVLGWAGGGNVRTNRGQLARALEPEPQ